MKKLILFISILVSSENLFSQFQEKLTNTQFNKLLTVFKGRRSDFGSYYFNNFPCSLCSNGYFYIKEGNSLQSLYSYKGISFQGILKSPQLNYEEKGNKLYVTSSWFNTGNTGGYKSANISFEFTFESEYNDWNTLLRFQSGNSEMVAYYTLTRKQLDDVYNILVNETKYKVELIEREKKVVLENREKFINDSLMDNKISNERIDFEKNKKYKDSLAIVKEVSIIKDPKLVYTSIHKFDKSWETKLPAYDKSKNYYIVVAGKWGMANSVAFRDASYSSSSSRVDIDNERNYNIVLNTGCDTDWLLDGICHPSPTFPKSYSTEHKYQYFLGKGKESGFSISFFDRNYWDNVGELVFKLYEIQ